MHIECNVFDNILKHLFGEWDTVEMCKDMEEVGVKPHLWLQHVGVNIMWNFMPHMCSPHMKENNFWILFQKCMLQQDM